MRKVVLDNPLADVATEGSKYIVLFLSKPLDPTLVRNPTLLDEPNARNPVLHAPTLPLNSATPRVRVA